MQAYKSTKNAEYERKMARKLMKQVGEIPFELAPNTSGRITNKFVTEYQEKELPFIYLTPMVDTLGHEFEVSAALTSRTTKDFTINIQNLSTEAVKGTILWFSV